MKSVNIGFILVNNSDGESLSVDFLLTILEIDSSPPTILPESFYEIFQFLHSKNLSSSLTEMEIPCSLKWMLQVG